MSKESSIVKVLDLFAGCGGFSSGMEMAGFKVIAANDIWEPAQLTHEHNHKDSKFFLGDITEESVRSNIIDYSKKQGCDVIIGGPPCQAYSMAGARQVDDTRGHLFKEYVKIVESLKPKIFIMENVKGILTMAHDRSDLDAKDQEKLQVVKDLEVEKADLMLLRKQSKNTDKFSFTESDAKRLEDVKADLSIAKKKTLHLREKVTDLIIDSFKEIGYKVEFRTLNAADYGVAQKRERVIFVGTRLDIPITFPEPTHLSRKNGKQLEFPTVTVKHHITVRETIGDLKGKPEDAGWSHIFSKHKPEFVEKIHNTPIGQSIYGGYSDAWFRNPPDEPSRTVKENHGGVMVHYEKDRVMTPRELARLQSFPDDFMFQGSKSKVLIQIGNAVPPLLGKAIGKAVKEMLRCGS